MSIIMGMRWEPKRRLTTREFDIWKYVAQGMSNKEIVELSEYTISQIEYCIMHLYEKLSVPDGEARRVKLALIFPVDLTSDI